jgi:hypothetical protein
MVTFWFRINDSFLGYPSHPITIPKSQVPYGEVAELLLRAKEVWISIDASPPVHGRIYHGIAGWGEYYQIRCEDPLAVLDTGLGRRQLSRVGLFVADGRLEVHIRRVSGASQQTAA